MKNKLADLNNYLFEQIERLQNDELSDEELQTEIKRSDAISKIATQIVNNTKTELGAVKLQLEFGRTWSDGTPVLPETVNRD